jgi:hypothetical protein
MHTAKNKVKTNKNKNKKTPPQWSTTHNSWTQTEVAASKHQSLDSHARLRFGHEQRSCSHAQQPMKQCLHHPKTPPPPVSSDHSHLHIPASANIVEIKDLLLTKKLIQHWSWSNVFNPGHVAESKIPWARCLGSWIGVVCYVAEDNYLNNPGHVAESKIPWAECGVADFNAHEVN